MWLSQYLSPYKLKELIRHYSEFVTHPVSLREIKTIQVPKEKDEFEEEEPKEDGDDDIRATLKRHLGPVTEQLGAEALGALAADLQAGRRLRSNESQA